MKDLDEKIRAALQEEDAELFEKLGEESSLHQMIGDTFRGKMRVFAWLVTLEILVFTGLGVFTAIRFFEANDVQDQLSWGGGFALCLFAIVALKLWWWMEMNKHALLRELKRVELQIARLAQRLRAGE